MSVVFREDSPLKDHLADMFFDLLRDSLLNAHYQNLVPPRDSNEFMAWGRYQYTGIAKEGLDNIRFCCESVIKAGTPGDFMECGVWRGGATIMMAAIAKYYKENRKTWVCDSFQGMPVSPDPLETYHLLTGLIAPLEEVQESFSVYRLAENVTMVPGWFHETIPTLTVGPISVLRLDNDYYESTALTLKHLYPHVPVGGFTIIDDYDCCPGCNRAVDDYREKFCIADQLYRVNNTAGTGVYWQKSQRNHKLF